jgi:hypothetical protein
VIWIASFLRLHIAAKFASLRKRNKSQIRRTESKSDKKVPAKVPARTPLTGLKLVKKDMAG